LFSQERTGRRRDLSLSGDGKLQRRSRGSGALSKKCGQKGRGGDMMGGKQKKEGGCASR